MMVTELNCRNVAIVEGGFDALAACLRSTTQDYGHLLLYNPEPKEWTAETMSAVLKPLWAQALSLVYGDKKDAAGKGSGFRSCGLFPHWRFSGHPVGPDLPANIA